MINLNFIKGSSATARFRPMVAIEPLSLYSKFLGGFDFLRFIRIRL